MSGSQSLALSFGELTLPIECLDQETEKRLRAQLKQGGKQPKITLAPGPGEDQDVEGHTFAGTLRSVLVHVKVGDGSQAQAVRVNFPTAQDAEHFRRNLIAAGLLAGTLAAGSIGIAALPHAGSASLAGQASGDAAQATAHGYFIPAEGSAATAHGYYVQVEGSQGTAHGYFVQAEEATGSVGTAHGYFQQAEEVTGSQGTAHGYFEQAAATTADESVVAGNPYSGKAAIGESLGLNDESAIPASQGTAHGYFQQGEEATGSQGTAHGYFEQAAPTAADESVVAGNPYSGKAAIGESLGLNDESAIPASQGTAHGYFQQANTTADEESNVPPGNPYSGKAAVDESLK